MDLVHDRGSMDPVHESGPWNRSKEGVHGPLVHVLSSPELQRYCSYFAAFLSRQLRCKTAAESFKGCTVLLHPAAT